MLAVRDAEDRTAALVSAAIAAGADAADALYLGDASTSVALRLGKLEDVARSEGEEIGLRVFVGQRSASVSSSDLSPDTISALVERAVAMAREAPEDKWAGLAPEDRLLRGALPALDLDDRADPAPALLRERALAAEDAARAVSGVTNSEGGGASAGRSTVALATSTGFAAGYGATSYGCSASVIAGEGAGMQRDYAFRQSRHLADLEAAESIGKRAGDRAVARLNPQRLPSGPMPVVFDKRVGATLLNHLIGAITGAAVARRTSFLLDRLGQAVFASGVTIHDDPHRRRGLRSRPFDGEGLATAPTAIVDDGVLTRWLLDSASARQLGLDPNGHASRGIGGAPGAGATNLSMAAGTVSRDALIAGIAHGVYITELIGQGVNGITGDYSRGASGFLITNGEIGPPIHEITIAGNLIDMYRALTPADDLELIRAVEVPTLLVEGMTVAGA